MTDHKSAIENSMGAAQTIIYRSQCQKRMVDHILTVSKLDPSLFSTTPVVLQPVARVEQLLKVLEHTLHAAGISRLFHVEGPSTAFAVK